MTTPLRAAALTEGALMAALTALIALVGIYLPVLQFVTNLFWTIPVVIVTVRHGLKTGFLSIFAAGVLIFILSGPLNAVFLIAQFGGLALFYGYAFHKRKGVGFTLSLGVILSTVSILLAFYLSYLFLGLRSVNIMEEFRQSIAPMIQMLKEAGVFERFAAEGITEESTRQFFAAFVELLSVILPSVLITSGILSAFINYLIAQKVLMKLGIEVPFLPPFMKWRLPWWFIWGYIAGFGSFLAGQYLKNDKLLYIGINIMYIYSPVLFVLGLAVAVFLIHKYLGNRTSFRVLLLAFVILFFNLANQILGIVGLVDLVFDYRRLSGEK